MAITIRLPQKGDSPLPAFQQANRKALERLRNNSGYTTFEKREKEKNAKLVEEATQHYAKKHGLPLKHHKRAWTFTAKSGEKISMPPGYFVMKDGVLHELICH